MIKPKVTTINPIPGLITVGVGLTWGVKAAGVVLLTLVAANVLSLAIKETLKTKGK